MLPGLPDYQLSEVGALEQQPACPAMEDTGGSGGSQVQLPHVFGRAGACLSYTFCCVTPGNMIGTGCSLATLVYCMLTAGDSTAAKQYKLTTFLLMVCVSVAGDFLLAPGSVSAF